MFVKQLKKLRMNTSKLTTFFERLFFNPNLFDWVFIIFLTPFSLLYGLVMLFRRLFTLKKSYGVPIVSIGNLTVGGSGKTPFVIAIAKAYDHAVIISRGYGRESRGLVKVSQKGEILTDVFSSGDEAMLMAKSLPRASVIVSEKREVAIEKAIEDGAEVIFLDDGFNRVNIKKYEILLFPKRVHNYFPFPAGPFREFFFMQYLADLVVKEERDFKRVVEIENRQDRMLLITAIANPKRLEPYLPKGVVDRIYLEDHAYFNEEALKKRAEDLDATSLLVTQKDEVKMEAFKLTLSVMKLELEIRNNILEDINRYIEEHRNAREN